MKRLSLFSLVSCFLTLVIAQDQGMTSPIHRQYVNQIVFATSPGPIAFRSENPSQFQTAFKSGQPIYARVYADKSLSNLRYGGLREQAGAILLYDLYINGEKVQHKKSFGMYRHIPDGKKTYYTEQMETDETFFQWTCWKHYVLPREDDEELKFGNRNIPARAFVLALLEQAPGTHQIRMEVKGLSLDGERKTKLIAGGEFSIELTAADKQKLAFRYAPPLPKDEWRGGNKQNLIAELTTAFEQEIRKKPIIVGLYGIDWKEGSYSLTGQKYRKLSAWAIFPDGDGDGQVPVTTFNWISDYTNGGWTKLRFDSHCNGCPNWDVEVAAVEALANP
ncbi:MAG: hypothetical protein AAF206_06330 [Bacteroidota bacterium]